MSKYFLFTKKNAYLCLFLATLGILLGRGYQHLFWDAPYRVILWDESLMRPLLESSTNIEWNVWTENVDTATNRAVKIIGWFYVFLAAILSLTFWRNRNLEASVKSYRWERWAAYLGAFGVLILALLYCKDHWFHLGQFFEFALQLSTFFLFLFFPYLFTTENQLFKKNKLFDALNFIVAITFLCHGLYAISYYPQPENYVTMTLNILHCEESTARLFLKIMGCLDLIVALILMTENIFYWRLKRTFLSHNLLRAALIYCIIWGFLTCSARVVGYFHAEIWQDILHQHFYKALYRVPHFLVPMTALWYYETNYKAHNRERNL